jgi:hypothetical protein
MLVSVHSVSILPPEGLLSSSGAPRTDAAAGPRKEQDESSAPRRRTKLAKGVFRCSDNSHVIRATSTKRARSLSHTDELGSFYTRLRPPTKLSTLSKGTSNTRDFASWHGGHPALQFCDALKRVPEKMASAQSASTASSAASAPKPTNSGGNSSAASSRSAAAPGSLTASVKADAKLPKPDTRIKTEVSLHCLNFQMKNHPKFITRALLWRAIGSSPQPSL